MLLALLFICGVLNFALGKAMLESGNPILDSLPPALRRGGGRVSLMLEFLILLAAMFLAASGWKAAAWLYGAYTAVNGTFCWLLIKGRI
ncbi:hypothetical protein [Erythrobacter mangrovi]|uniref:DUF3784 domain-containing protein n=1 Tax=Erythrobacter mangrovi TaxID=2739433 RepID=A0A7D4BFS9_9SPHN|nr:hypothetical protein [Erythrobacter mangrovi]QKG70882.1 hypothetical protein HQR01_05575 [Erythrobacter mangrovi]